MPLFRQPSVRVALGTTLALACAFALRALPRAQAAPPAQPSTLDGRKIYDDHCATCHGVDGRGDGPAALLLSPVPRDFTVAKYKIRSTPTGDLPTDDDLVRSVRDGLNATSMPGWKGVLSDAQIRAVVEYVKTFSPRFRSESPLPVSVTDQPSQGPDSVDRGRVVYAKLQCGTCHGTDGRGAGAVASNFVDDWGRPLAATDLTEPWTFRGGATARDVYLRLRTGMAGTPMPSFADAATDREMWDVAGYVVSMGRRPAWKMNGAEVEALFAAEERDAHANPVKRGEYLVNALGCPLCHTPADEHAGRLPGLTMAGGMHIRIEPFGDYYTTNLTSDRETGLGATTDAEIKRTVTEGILPDGTRLPPYPMDWPSFSTLAPADLDAIVAYLRTLPPVYNKVPPYSRPALPVYLWGKFKMLILRQDPPLTFFPGNAGRPRGGRS